MSIKIRLSLSASSRDAETRFAAAARAAKNAATRTACSDGVDLQSAFARDEERFDVQDAGSSAM